METFFAGDENVERVSYVSRDDADWCSPAAAPRPTLIAIPSPNIYQTANSAKVWPVKKTGDKMTIIPCLRLARQKGGVLQSGELAKWKA